MSAGALARLRSGRPTVTTGTGSPSASSKRSKGACQRRSPSEQPEPGGRGPDGADARSSDAAASALVTFSSGGLKTVAAMVTYGVLALAVYNWTRSRPGQDRFWMWLAISVIGVAVVGLVEYMTGTYIWNAPAAGFWRINSTFKDPNIYARFLTIGVVTAVILASRSRARWRGLFIATVVVGSAALPFTFSRQGWVLGGAVLALAVVLAPR